MKVYENEVSKRSRTLNEVLQYRVASGFDALMKISTFCIVWYYGAA
jgi:hypothetical protein